MGGTKTRAYTHIFSIVNVDKCRDIVRLPRRAGNLDAISRLPSRAGT